MIICEICEKYVHADDTVKCYGCGADVCYKCYDEHIKRCLNPDIYNEDDEGFEF